jgi:hypothetical protein
MLRRALQPIYRDAKAWLFLVVVATRATAVFSEEPEAVTPADRELQRELVARGKRDQDIRARLIAAAREHQVVVGSPEFLKQCAPQLEEMSGIDAENVVWLKGIVERQGWPGRTLAGGDGSDAAFLIVQHATHDLEFQRHCLRLMQAAADGEVGKPHLALLTDRIRLREGMKQVYGTQIEHRDGRWQVEGAVEEPESLDARREKMGLPPLEQYLREAAALYGK